MTENYIRALEGEIVFACGYTQSRPETQHLNRTKNLFVAEIAAIKGVLVIEFHFSVDRTFGVLVTYQ